VPEHGGQHVRLDDVDHGGERGLTGAHGGGGRSEEGQSRASQR
jgi:hypothetical protein